MLKPYKSLQFHQGYFQMVELLHDTRYDDLPKRYHHMVGQGCIDRPPVSSHDWLNRMFALIHWFGTTDPTRQTSLRSLLRECIAACKHHIQDTNCQVLTSQCKT